MIRSALLAVLFLSLPVAVHAKAPEAAKTEIEAANPPTIVEERRVFLRVRIRPIHKQY